jgi:hypothetical protein
VRSSILGLLRLASLAICLVVIASFAIFVFEQARGAATDQREALVKGAASNTDGESPRTSEASTPPSTSTTSSPENGIHKAIDEASENLTSPFSGITAGSSSAWTINGVNLLLTLVIYGFGVGFLANVLRSRR